MTRGMTLPDVRRYATESEVQAAIVQLAKACGAVIYSTSQGYRSAPGGTRCTPGIPDLMLFFPKRSHFLFWETKTRKGRRTAAQVRFGRMCGECMTDSGHGDLESFKLWLQSHGLIA